MKITLLGTSHGYPEPHRGCSCTLIEVQGRYYVIDMGIMLIEKLTDLGIAVDDVKGLFFTHMHGDHTDGLPGFVDLLSWHYKTAKPEIYLPSTECVAPMREWIRCTGHTMRELCFHQVREGLICDDGFIRVTAIPTQHCALSYAYLVEAEGKSILFTGDLKHPAVDFPQIAFRQALDLLIAEVAHFDIEVYPEILNRVPVKSICFNHYNPRRIGGFMDVKKALEPIPVRLATDGLVYSL